MKYKKTRPTVFREVTNVTVNRNLKKVVALAGIEKDVTFHMARHTFGTILGKTETPYTISELMGHNKLESSMVYVNTTIDTLKERIKNVKFER